MKALGGTKAGGLCSAGRYVGKRVIESLVVRQGTNEDNQEERM